MASTPRAIGWWAWVVALAVFSHWMSRDQLEAQHHEIPMNHTLHWQNGDRVNGNMVSADGQSLIWQSPLSDVPMELSMVSLKQMQFASASERAQQAFRVLTTGGDVLHGDLLQTDSQGLVLGSPRLGRVHIPHRFLFGVSLNHYPDEEFDGALFDDWLVALGGPIQNMSYRVAGQPPAQRMDLIHAKSMPESDLLAQGMFASSYFDVGLSREVNGQWILFEGDIDVQEAGKQTFQARCDGVGYLLIDGDARLVEIGQEVSGVSLDLDAGPHRIALIHVHEVQAPDMRVWWSGPGFRNRSLVGTNRASGWQANALGHAQTQLNRSAIFKPTHLPRAFELEFEFETDGSPQFVLSLARNETVAEKEDAFRLEVHGQEVILMHRGGQESVMMLNESPGILSLRMNVDSEAGWVRFQSGNGRQLKLIEEVEAPVGLSGIYLRNKGESLAVRRFKLRSLDVNGVSPLSQMSPLPVVVGGALPEHTPWAIQSNSIVLNQSDPEEIEDLRLIRLDYPDQKMIRSQAGTVWSFADGECVHGDLVSAGKGVAHLRVAFAEAPVDLSLEQISQVDWLHSPNLYKEPDDYRDLLEHPQARLRGRLVSGATGFLPGWVAMGASQPIPLRLDQPIQVRLHHDNVSPIENLDHSSWPSRVTTVDGEVFFCEILSMSGNQLYYRSPFHRCGNLPVDRMRALEFLHAPERLDLSRPANRPDALAQLVLRRKEVQGSGRRRGDQDLSMIRNQSDVPSWPHQLVARNGDLLKGQLLGMTQQHLRFLAKSREQIFDRSMVAGVVSMSPSPPYSKLQASNATEMKLLLADSTEFHWKPLQADSKLWWGKTHACDEVRVPFDQLIQLSLGGAPFAWLPTHYDDWLTPEP